MRSVREIRRPGQPLLARGNSSSSARSSSDYHAEFVRTNAVGLPDLMATLFLVSPRREQL